MICTYKNQWWFSWFCLKRNTRCFTCIIFLREKKKSSLKRTSEAKDISKITKSKKSNYMLNVIYKNTITVFFLSDASWSICKQLIHWKNFKSFFHLKESNCCAAAFLDQILDSRITIYLIMEFQCIFRIFFFSVYIKFLFSVYIELFFYLIYFYISNYCFFPEIRFCKNPKSFKPRS